MILALVSACTPNDPKDVEAGMVVIGASDDGVLTIEAPAGSDGSNVEVTVSPLDVTGLFEAGEVLGYELGPDGQTFDEPVTIRFRLDASDLGLEDGDLPLVSVLSTEDRIDFEPLEIVEVLVADGELLVAALASHFTEMDIIIFPGQVFGVDLPPRFRVRRITLEVGDIIEIGFFWRSEPDGYVESASWSVTPPPELRISQLEVEVLPNQTTTISVECLAPFDGSLTSNFTAQLGPGYIFYKYGKTVFGEGDVYGLFTVVCVSPPTTTTSSTKTTGGEFTDRPEATTLSPLEAETERLLSGVLDLDRLPDAPDVGLKLLYVKCPSDDCKAEAREYEEMVKRLGWGLEIVEDGGAGFCEWTTNLNEIAAAGADVVILRTYFWGVDTAHCPQEAVPFENLMASSGVVVGVNTSSVYDNLIGFESEAVVEEHLLVAYEIIKQIDDAKVAGDNLEVLAFGSNVANAITGECPTCEVHILGTDGPYEEWLDMVETYLRANPAIRYVQAWDAQTDQVFLGLGLSIYGDSEADFNYPDFIKSVDFQPRESPEMRAWLSVDLALRHLQSIDVGGATIPRYSRTVIDGLDPFADDQGVPEDFRDTFTQAWQLDTP